MEFKNSKYLASIIDDSMITCYEIINGVAESYKEKTKLFQQKLFQQILIR